MSKRMARDKKTASLEEKVSNGHLVTYKRTSSKTIQTDPIDWRSRKESKVSDDGTNSFFWRAHTLTVLFLLACFLFYVAIFEEIDINGDYNTKRGIYAVVVVFLLFGVTQTPDGPFIRPHPALWRFVLCASVVYELGLIFMLFQTVDDARLFMRHFDPALGVELPEKDYGGNCLIYDPDSTDDHFHNLWDKMDGFVVMHLIGWWLKALILRDYWLCNIISVMFEILEYSLEHQLPNFSECWWDHWIMDALVCNGLGIYLGMKTAEYLNMKTYKWRNVWSIPSFSGKIKRVAEQFTPYAWINYEWNPFQSFGRWMAVLTLIFAFLLAELNTFYLKFVLWLAPPHYLNIVRLCIILLSGAVALRETYQYLDDPECKKFGRQSWVVLAIVITEFLIIARFDWNTISKPLPWHVILFWTSGLIFLFVWTVWNFFICPYFLVKAHFFTEALNKEEKYSLVGSSDILLNRKRS